MPKPKPEDGATPCVYGWFRSSWWHFWLEMGVVVLGRKESLEKEFPTGSSQRKLIGFLPINWNWNYKGRE